jgi:hypothetical protein
VAPEDRSWNQDFPLHAFLRHNDAWPIELVNTFGGGTPNS